MLGIQGVIKLAIGDIELLYAENVDGESRGYLLKLNDIAIKFLGIAKLPPTGYTSFYLFGNPDPGASGSSLGWYAVYKRPDESETLQLTADAEPGSSTNDMHGSSSRSLPLEGSQT